MNPAVDIPTYRGDPILLMLGVALISIGLIAIASASIEYSDFHFGHVRFTPRSNIYLRKSAVKLECCTCLHV